ncbi:unnamed protein product [Rotaria sordida]|uniref:FAM20 C-terminal domain-containing protein n=1 Tax=Rotaria sordida TaxID=392033 RepID=A0A815ZPH0_9BILA|nr:unnamed protein product [Rotaria sordida]CAF1586861.1 unnamed protein product [Rotaria sordida]
MWYLSFRVHCSFLFSLTILSLFCLVTFYTFLWPTTDLEPQENISKFPKPPVDVSFWSVLCQENICDIKATKTLKLTNHASSITRQRIDELYQLVHRAQNDQIDLSNIKKSHYLDPTWTFEKFIEQKSKNDTNDTSEHDDSSDSDSEERKKPKLSFTNEEKTINEHDKKQLRYFIHHVLAKWKQQHLNDTIINLADLMHDTLAQDDPEKLNTTWFQFMKTVNNLRVYDTHSSQFKNLFKYLQYGKITKANEMSHGTQIKILLDLPNGFQGLLKPYRVPRNYQTPSDHFYFSDIERHYAEIAAFHVDKILGFNRVPPVIGRVLNITSDIREKATHKLARTFFISPANNTCFYGHCSYYCDIEHAVCGKPGDQLEGSVQVLLPESSEIVWEEITHPYRRSYRASRKAKWELNENYCYEYIMIDEYYHNRLLLDMMDLSAFDFIIGNLDRHHMMRISSFGNNTALLHLDHGRSFGRYDDDDLSILTPIRHCCFFRYKTFARLYRVYKQGFSKLVSNSLKTHEGLQMILIDEHLIAIDRRLEIIFAHLETCIKTYTVKGVMIDDGVD